MENFERLNGKNLYYSFIAGSQKIFDHYKGINKINVFPVADGDTGTNLASTLRSIIDTSIPTDNVKVTAGALADAALVGARGNSGIIFAQFIYGMSNEIQDEKDLSVSDFAVIMNSAIRYAYEAIANPVEGTMITVIREWAEYIYKIKDKCKDFNQLIIRSYEKAKESLSETPKKLAILEKSKVVDAGGQGFVYFLEGMIEFFKNGNLKYLVAARNISRVPEIADIHLDDSEISFRYCTEALIDLHHENTEKNEIMNLLNQFGDSAVVAGSSKKIRIHVHTDTPADLFTQLRPYGNFTFKKVDDMVMQHEIVKNRKHRIALVTDSTCDLPADILEEHQVQVVPLTLHFKNDFYIDNVTIKPDDFYRLLKERSDQPTTSQPAYKEFLNKYNYLSSHYESIIAIHISHQLSGTWNTSRKAAHVVRERQNKRISVIDSKGITGTLGLIVLRAAIEISNGATHDELVKEIENWTGKIKLYANTPSLKYLIKGGRVGYVKGNLGKLLGIQPIVTLTKNGGSEVFGKPKSQLQSMKMTLNEVERLLEKNDVWGYSIEHANAPEDAQWYEEKMTALTGMAPAFVTGASPVLGAHAGPGLVVLNVLFR